MTHFARLTDAHHPCFAGRRSEWRVQPRRAAQRALRLGRLVVRRQPQRLARNNDTIYRFQAGPCERRRIVPVFRRLAALVGSGIARMRYTQRLLVNWERSCAALFGWPKERIEVIDDDLGKSGTSSDSRGGFQRLIAEIGLGKAGLVLSLDASRLARNIHDWHQLLELCSLFGVLIADGERVYDPCAYHDRLLLGLNGMVT